MKDIDITKYDDFINVGFKECCGCGWAFSPAEFDRHACSDMEYSKIHNHLDGLFEEPIICPDDCPVKIGESNKKLPEGS